MDRFRHAPGDGSLSVSFGVELEVILTPSAKYEPKKWTAQELFDKIMTKRGWKPNNTNYQRWQKFTLEDIMKEDPASVASYTNEHLALWLEKEYAVYLQKTAAQAKQEAIEHRKAHVSWFDDKANRDYSQWQITEDISLNTNHAQNKYGIEFVGPIMEIKNSPDSFQRVKSEINFFYSFLTQHCGFKVEADTSCSTHVHASLGLEPSIIWRLQDVQRLACAAYLFEPALNAITPVNRVTTFFAKGLRMNPIAAALPAPLIKEYDGNAQIKITQGQVIDNLNLLDVIDDAGITKYLIPDRNCAWNFSNLKIFAQTNIGTIEYRRPPGSATADDALRWIELVSSFGLAACASTQLKDLPLFEQLSVGALATFIRPFRAVPEAMETSLDKLLKENAKTQMGMTAVQSNELALQQQAAVVQGLRPQPIPPPPPPRTTISPTAVEMVQAAAAQPGTPPTVRAAAAKLVQQFEEQQQAASGSADPPKENN